MFSSFSGEIETNWWQAFHISVYGSAWNLKVETMGLAATWKKLLNSDAKVESVWGTITYFFLSEEIQYNRF